MNLKNCIFSVSLAVFATITVQAKIIRVNNTIPVNEPSQNLYKAFSDAYNAPTTVGGDTIMFEGSQNAYTHTSSTFGINKRLVILGPGYFLDKNPQTQASNLGAELKFVFSFEAGSAGSVVSGLYFNNTSPFFEIAEDNIFIHRCRLQYLRFNLRREGNNVRGISGIKIIGNFIEYYLSTETSSSIHGFSDVELKNNIILGYINFISGEQGYPQKVFSNIENNTFFTSSGDFRISTASFKNNILFIGSNSTVNISSQIIQNNLVNGNQLGSSNNNRVYSVNDGALFAGSISQNREDPDNEFKVVNTRFNTMGSDGKEPGAFGGANPYVLSGLPQIPAIYELTTTGTGSAAGGLPVTIKVKSN